MNFLEYFFASGIALIVAILFSGCVVCENMSSDYYYDVVLPVSVQSGEWLEDESIQAHEAVIGKDRILLCRKTGCLRTSEKDSGPMHSLNEVVKP